ncbi:hypothetical protein E4U43_008536 [Claviceps pusilla]|uniref:Response regulatory domain-containing protein n=1 Tax=Claviceps pusilla TaxID=123648 RepID=A0A9P7SX80_9HYPO|nr:hypothetical protein E4U43_008536 [Claviceps pusilla]
MTSDNVGLMPFFFPKADAAVLSSRCEAPPAARPQTVWPVFDKKHVDQPLGPWPSDMEKFFYPSKPEPFAAASIPEQPACPSGRYMRAFLARNERLRSSMLWYYTRNIFNETELLAGLQEKAFLAQESTDWEFVVIGILVVNYYIRLATVGLPLTIMPRGETICAHVVSEPPGLLWRIGDFEILPTWSLVDFGQRVWRHILSRVALVASAVDGGSHFRVVFQEVDFVHSTPMSRQTTLLTGRLTKGHSSFYVMPTSRGTALCDYFTRFLTNNGLKASASANSSTLILFDYEDDWEQHCRSVSQIPPGHVAICLTPTSAAVPLQRNAPSNIMYVKGPFPSLTLMETLEELDRRLEEMAFSHDARLLRVDASSPSSSALKSPSLVDSDADTTSSITSPESIAPDLADENVLCLSSACATDAALPVEEATAVLPLFAALTLPNPTALLVDDNVVNLRIMQMYCKRRKLSYHCATDGAQAVATFSQQQSLMAAGRDGQGIQIIFMDLQMPVCDGFEATRQIRQLERQHGWTESTIFIVTGQDSPSDRKTADNIGAHEYFVKPVGIKVLDVGVKRYFPSFEMGR